MSGRGVERILDLIEWFASFPGAATLSEVSAALGMPKSSALQMLRTMTERGYLQRDAKGDYLLVRLPGDVTGAAGYNGALLALAAPLIAKAVEDVSESGFLAVMEGRDIRYLNKILPDREIRYDRDMTKSRPAHKVASGIVILAASSPEVVDAYAEELPAEEREAMEAMIERAQRDGFFFNAQGVVEGAAGVAAPILDASGRVVGAVNISGPRERMAAAADQVCKAAKDTARAITEVIARRAVRRV